MFHTPLFSFSQNSLLSAFLSKSSTNQAYRIVQPDTKIDRAWIAPGPVRYPFNSV